MEIAVTSRGERIGIALSGSVDQVGAEALKAEIERLDLSQTREVVRFYEKEGFHYVTLLEIPGAHHYHGFDLPWVRKGFDALDAPLDP